MVFAVFCFSLLVGVSELYASEVLGRVERVIDGDTLILVKITNKPNIERMNIRLSEIDTPERDQPYGLEAKSALENLVRGQKLRVKNVTRDRYDRIIAEIHVGDIWVNRELVKSGHAWVYRRFSRNRRLIKLEEAAKSHKIGLWSLPKKKRIAPWKWRRLQKKKKKQIDPNLDKRCYLKTKCTQMKSCKEAFFYLKTCRFVALDANNNGIPCENICKINGQ